MSGFRFKKFYVAHDRCAMKVGTDGVLLGALASESGRRVLDVGCGSGLISLMLAQRNPDADILAVDIDQNAVSQAIDNFHQSPWADRLKTLCVDINELETIEKFDHIVSNPPYYEYSQDARDEKRNMARRTDSLTYKQLAQSASRLLSEEGLLEVIIPYDVAADFQSLCKDNSLQLIKRTDIRTKNNKPFKRSVLTLVKTTGKTANNQEVSLHELTLLNADSSRSDEFINLTKDFYL